MQLARGGKQDHVVAETGNGVAAEPVPMLMNARTPEKTERPTTDRETAIILFDGVCNLCSAAVRFIVRRDPRNRLRFAPLQSDIGQRLLAKHGFNQDRLDGVIFIEGQLAHSRSEAALRIAAHLSGAWPVLSVLRVVPRFVRDGIYDWIAANRHRWFGKKNECMIPTPEMRQRFLEGSLRNLSGTCSRSGS